ncbi:MAG: autotransporter domain-containing protein [Pseudomonadota bacterium]
MQSTIALVLVFLCVTETFADTYKRTEVSDNVWEFTNFITKDDHTALYTIVSGNVYDGASTYANDTNASTFDVSGAGGLIYVSSDVTTTTTINLGEGSTFENWKLRYVDNVTEATFSRGGVFYASDLDINGSATFSNNYVFGTHTDSDNGHSEVSGGLGGVIFANDLDLEGGSTFQYNFADQQGGAIAANGTVVIGENTTFTENISYSGGAIYSAGKNASLAIGADSTFQYNKAYYGGAISAGTSGTTVTIGDGTVFTNNVAEGYGGALYVANAVFNYTGTTEGFVVSSGNTIANLLMDDVANDNEDGFDHHYAFYNDASNTDSTAYDSEKSTYTYESLAANADLLNNADGGGFLYLRKDGTATFNVTDQYKIVRIGADDVDDENGIYANDSNLDSIASGTNATFIKAGAGILVVNSRLEDFQGTVWVQEGVMDIRRANLGDGATTIFAGGSSVASAYGDASYALLNFYNDAIGDDYAENHLINGTVIAGRGGVVMLGTESTTAQVAMIADDNGYGGLDVPENEWTPDRFDSYGITWGANGVSSIMLVREQHTLDSTGSLTADSSLTSATSVASNTVNLGMGSLFIVDYDSINANKTGYDFADVTSEKVQELIDRGSYDYDTWLSDYSSFTIIEGNAAIIGDGSTVLNVSGDAMLLLVTEDAPKEGDVFLVLQDFDANSSSYWTSSQININKIGLDWDDMIGGWFDNDFYVVMRDVTAEEAFGDSGLDSGLYDVLDEAASAGKDLDTDAEDAGERFIGRVTDGDRIVDQKEQVKNLEGTAKTTFVAAIPQIALSVSNSFSSALENRTSISSGASQGVTMRRDDNGQWAQSDMSTHEREPQYGASLWAIGHHEHQDGSFGTGNFDAEYHATFTGVSFGGDYAFSPNFLAGIAFHVGSGNVHSTGDFSGTTNDFDYTGAGLYAAYMNRNFALHADVAYTMLTNDIGRALPASVKASDKDLGLGEGTRTLSDLTADNDTTALTAGLRAEYAFSANRFNLIPHLGIRATHISSKAYDLKSGSETVIAMRDMDATIYQAPVGLTISTLRTFDNDWTMRPYADISLIAAFGDLEATQSMTFTGLTTEVSLDADIADALSGRATVGLEFYNDDFVFGANGFYQGSQSLRSVGVNVNVAYTF